MWSFNNYCVCPAYWWNQMAYIGIIGLLINKKLSIAHNIIPIFSMNITLKLLFSLIRTYCRMNINKNIWSDKFKYHSICLKLSPCFLSLFMPEKEIFQLWGQYHVCWCPGSLSHQSISRHGVGCARLATWIVVPELISSTMKEPNPRWNSKCEYIFCYL